MLGIFSGLLKHVPGGRKRDEHNGETITNILHFRVTTGILFCCVLLVTCLEWIGNGNKITCILEGPVDNWVIPQNVINTFCYISSTFTLPKHYNSRIGHDSVGYGVGAHGSTVYSDGDENYKAYYQWVPFVLLLQGILFYVPHCLFKIWEGGKIQKIIAGLDTLILNRDDRANREKILAKYVVESLGTHNGWALKMLFVEFLNLINVIFNIVFVDIFLAGEFRTYGLQVLELLESDPEKRIDPMSKVFPRVTKCTYHKFGPGGTIQNHDALCVLPINIINEKIYVFIWFWFLTLTVITIFGIIYHIFYLISPGIIKMTLNTRTMNQKDIHLDEMGEKFEVGDWKLLMILSQNMEPLVFGEFLRKLHLTMEMEFKKKKKVTKIAKSYTSLPA